MIVAAFIQGELGHLLNAQAKAVDRGARKAMKIVAGGIRRNIQRQVTQAGFARGGRTLAKAVRSRTRGRSVDIEAEVTSKATYAAGTRRPGGLVDLVQLFGQGTVIGAANGGWLAIPTKDAPLKSARGPVGQAMTPADMDAAGLKPAAIPARGGRMVIVIRQGRQTIVTHILVRQVSLRQRYDLQATIDRSAGQFPEILVREINAAADASAVLQRYGG